MRVGSAHFLDVPVAHDEPLDGSGITFLSPAECMDLPRAEYLVRNMMAPGQVGCMFGIRPVRASRSWRHSLPTPSPLGTSFSGKPHALDRCGTSLEKMS